MTDFTTVQLEKDPRGFATLWLGRPEKNNAFNALMIRELIAAIAEVQADDALRFLLLRGRGKHFSAGADLAWMRESATLDFETNLTEAHELAELMYRLYHLKLPTLAVVQGAAFGGAVGLIACCDMAIGAVDAQLSLSEVRIGLAPAVISPFVVKAIGERATRRYALTGERFSGERARELGLLSETYAAETLDDSLCDWIDTLLLNSPCASARICCARSAAERSARRCAVTPRTASPAFASAPRARRGWKPFWRSASRAGRKMPDG